MSLDIKAAVELLEKSFGESIDNIYIPSLKKEVGFRPLTVGMQKSISKMSIDFEFDLDYQLLKVSTLKTLCIEDIDFLKLTEVDFIAILAQLRQNNFTEPLTLILNCLNPECKKQYNFNINLEQIIQKCKEYERHTEMIKKQAQIGDEMVEFTFELQESTVMSNLEYLHYTKLISENNEEDVVDINNSQLLAYPLKFIRNIYIGGQQITQTIDGEVKPFSDLPMIEKIRFIDTLPPKVYSEGKNSVLSQVLKHYPHSRLLSLFPTAKCPYCKTKREGVVTNDSFFII